MMKSNRLSLSLAFILLSATAVSCDDNDSAVCGNGVLEDGETCDIMAGVPNTCSEYSPDKTWISGHPGCSNDCKALTIGTCIEKSATPPVNQNPVCGNNIVETGEVCDYLNGIPKTCAEFDPSKEWISGAPACAPDCKSIVVGSCKEKTVAPEMKPVCGNGKLESGEACDGSEGVPETCSAFDNTKTWESGKPACSTSCQITAGTCKEKSADKPEPTDPTTPTDQPDPNKTDADVTSTEKCNQTESSIMEETCSDQIAHFCSEAGFVTDRDCKKLSTADAPLTCQVSADSGYADCVASCSSTFADYAGCKGKYIEYHMCEKAKDGKTYEFLYTAEKPCPVACDGGRCVATAGPEVGASCGNDFQNQCYGGNAYTCKNGKITKETCGSGQTCAMQFGSNSPVCTERCSTKDQSSYSCQTIDGKPAQKNKICVMAADSKMYWFEENAICKESCSEGICDISVPKIGSTCKGDMTDECIHNSVYYCRTDTHTIDVMTCGKGEFVGSQLCRKLTDDYASCVFPCSEGSESILQCGGSNDKGTAYTDNFICEKALDGEYYMFSHEESCPNGCSNGTCL